MQRKQTQHLRLSTESFRLDDCAQYELGAEIKADVFAEGDKIDVTAKTKGKGYAGGLKRHGLKSGRFRTWFQVSQTCRFKRFSYYTG